MIKAMRSRSLIAGLFSTLACSGGCGGSGGSDSEDAAAADGAAGDVAAAIDAELPSPPLAAKGNYNGKPFDMACDFTSPDKGTKVLQMAFMMYQLRCSIGGKAPQIWLDISKPAADKVYDRKKSGYTHMLFGDPAVQPLNIGDSTVALITVTAFESEKRLKGTFKGTWPTKIREQTGDIEGTFNVTFP